MINLNMYQDLWKLMKNYRFDIDLSHYKDLVCGICHELLVNANYNTCGCRYCYECIQNYAKEGNKNCPGLMKDCNGKIDINQLKPDYVANRKLSLLNVQCPIPNCLYKSELKSLEKHLITHTEDCPYVKIGCDRLKPKMEHINDHMILESCKHSQLLISEIENLKAEVKIIMANSMDINSNQKQIMNIYENQRKEIESFKLESSKSKAEIESLINTVTRVLNQFQVTPNTENLVEIKSLKAKIIKIEETISKSEIPNFRFEQKLQDMKDDLKKNMLGLDKKRGQQKNDFNKSIDRVYEKIHKEISNVRLDYSSLKRKIDGVVEDKKISENKLKSVEDQLMKKDYKCNKQISEILKGIDNMKKVISETQTDLIKFQNENKSFFENLNKKISENNLEIIDNTLVSVFSDADNEEDDEEHILIIDMNESNSNQNNSKEISNKSNISRKISHKKLTNSYRENQIAVSDEIVKWNNSEKEIIANKNQIKNMENRINGICENIEKIEETFYERILSFSNEFESQKCIMDDQIRILINKINASIIVNRKMSNFSFFECRIDRFQSKMKEAQDGTNCCFVSDWFEFDRYKMRMEIHPFGDKSIIGDNMSVFFILEYSTDGVSNSNLMNYSVTISLVNQHNNDNYFTRVFDKPISADKSIVITTNPYDCFGDSEFIKLSMIYNPGFYNSDFYNPDVVKDDSVLFRCSINAIIV